MDRDRPNPFALIHAAAICLLVLALCAVAVITGGGCIAYKAPVVSYIRGPEANYNQERSAVMSRSTNAEQQVAETTAEQQQQENTADAIMPTAMDLTSQLGLKQGQGTAQAATAGESNTGATLNADQTQQGQAGGDALGQTPTVYNAPGGNAQSPAAPITVTPAPPPEEPVPPAP